MARTKRKPSSVNIYNVGIKGADSQLMFLDDEDREKFLSALEDACEKYEVGVAARVLMSNHVHLVMHGDLEKLARVFKSLGASYVGYFNRKYGRSGPLWNARYYSDAIETKESYMQVSAYIFNNPVVAGIVKTLDAYQWSNFRALRDGDDPHGRKFMAKVNYPDEVLQYALDYSKAKSDEKFASKLEVLPKTRVCDHDLYKFIEDFTGTKSFTNALNENEELLQNLLENLLDLGSNVNQMSRVTSIHRGRIRKLLA